MNQTNLNKNFSSNPKPEVKPNVLYIDDDTDNLTSFKYQFQDYYNILLAESGEDGYEIMKQHDVPVVIADQRMPNMTGTEFFQKIIPEFPHTKRMILTGYSDIHAVIEAINIGRVYYYLQKPWNEQEVILIIKNALESLEFQKQNEGLIRTLQRANERLEKHKIELNQRIEERKRAEERFRNLFENNPISIWEEDFSDVKNYLDNIDFGSFVDYNEYFDNHPEIVNECINLIRVIDINQATLRFHDLKEKGELLGKLKHIFDPESCGMFKREFIAILNGELHLEEEANIATIDGKQRYSNIHWSVPPGYESNYARVLVSIVDITERKLAVEALRESEERFRNIYENSTVGIYQTSLDGKMLLANPAIITMFGYDNFEDFKNKTALDHYVNKNTRDTFLEIINREGTIYGFEEEMYTKGGTKLVILESARLVKDKTGNGLYIEGVVEDITDRKAFENALIEARNKAEESDRLKSEFLAQMSHEIRTPINVILNFTNLLKEDIQDKIGKDIKDSFDCIENAGHRIIRTIDLILNMSDIQIGSFKPSFTNVDLLGEIIQKLEHEFRPYADSKDLTLTLTSTAKATHIIADSYSVGQIFSNLIDNAIKYTKKGGIQIIVENKTEDEVSVTVSDSGIGIADEYIPHMYEPFSQEEHGYTRRYDGTGLGLALVKKYVEINNARVEIKSQKGKGSSFVVTFLKAQQ